VPDLAVHLAGAWVLARFLPAAPHRACFYAGTVLTDVLFRILILGLHVPIWYAEVVHSPLWILWVCYALALLFEEPFRKAAFFCLAGGAWLHILMDAAKDYLGHGAILWAFPFSMDRFEFGWMIPEDTVWLSLGVLGAVAAAELRLLSRTRPTRQNSSNDR
jgi:hypothetical protein